MSMHSDSYLATTNHLQTLFIKIQNLNCFIFKCLEVTLHGFVCKCKIIFPKHQSSSISSSAIVMRRELFQIHSLSSHRTASVQQVFLPGVNNSITSASVDNLLRRHERQKNTETHESMHSHLWQPEDDGTCLKVSSLNSVLSFSGWPGEIRHHMTCNYFSQAVLF